MCVPVNRTLPAATLVNVFVPLAKQDYGVRFCGFVGQAVLAQPGIGTLSWVGSRTYGAPGLTSCWDWSPRCVEGLMEGTLPAELMRPSCCHISTGSPGKIALGKATKPPLGAFRGYARVAWEGVDI